MYHIYKSYEPVLQPSIYTANALELLQPWTKPSICYLWPIVVIIVNSFKPRDDLWDQGFFSTLVQQEITFPLSDIKPLPQPRLTYCQLKHPKQTSLTIKLSDKTFRSFEYDIFENAICKMLTIFPRPQWVNILEWCCGAMVPLHLAIVLYYA